MPKSMTAFASTTNPYPWGTLTWELRSINHRFLEASFRLPETARHLENNYRENLRQDVQRGKLECTLRIDYSHTQTLEINLEIAQQHLQACQSIERLIQGPSSPLSPSDILKVPGVVQKNAIKPEELEAAMLQSYKQTLRQLITARAREGDRLTHFIQERLKKISGEINKIRGVLPQIQEHQQQKITDKLAALNTPLDEGRLEQELVYLANKNDVEEELDRLESHLEEFHHALSSDKPVGRRLDFLLQELNREANTLASKSQAAVTTYCAVELKVLIEQIREQVQNLE